MHDEREDAKNKEDDFSLMKVNVLDLTRQNNKIFFVYYIGNRRRLLIYSNEIYRQLDVTMCLHFDAQPGFTGNPISVFPSAFFFNLRMSHKFFNTISPHNMTNITQLPSSDQSHYSYFPFQNSNTLSWLKNHSLFMAQVGTEDKL